MPTAAACTATAAFPITPTRSWSTAARYNGPDDHRHRHDQGRQDPVSRADDVSSSGSGFLDDFNALNQSCTDLIGTAGITAADCTQVNKALLAVEMNATWGCSGAIPPPPLCPTGTPAFTFQDNFEAVDRQLDAEHDGRRGVECARLRLRPWRHVHGVRH